MSHDLKVFCEFMSVRVQAKNGNTVKGNCPPYAKESNSQIKYCLLSTHIGTQF